jgi:ubiquinone/menaquinone biosynthesis C-methylase UbiE
MDEQRRLILDQFTRQAVPFLEMHARDDAEIYRLLIETAGIGSQDEVLDVACGPGLVVCEVARVARHVTGVDLTRAMIEQAEARQRSLGLTNVTWYVGDAQPLAFPDAAFSGHHPVLVPPLHRPGRGRRRDGQGLPARRAGDRLRRVY